MDVYVSFLKTVFQTIVTLVSAAAALFATSPGSPTDRPAQDVSLRRAAFVRQVETNGDLLARLSSGDPVERTRAACEAQKARGASASALIPALVNLLADATPVDGRICGDRWGSGALDVPTTSPGERAAAALASAGSAAFEPLAAAVTSPQWVARKNAAWALGALDDARGARPLLGAVQDPEAPVRRSAAWALGALDSSEAVSALAAAVARDSDAEVRSQAAWALGAIGDRDGALALVRALADAEARVRRQAAWALGAIGDRQGVDGLIKALRDDADGPTRAQAAWALGAIGDGRASGALAAALKDSEVKVRRQAAWALGVVGR